ncbi:MAG: hypothetical protein NVS2B12_08940 [Ktedonobacteraceae bacterium]
MNARGRSPLLSIVLFAIVLLISACSQTTSGSTASNLSPAEVLQKSADAMKQLKSSHVEINSNSNVQTNGGATTTATAGTPTASNSNFVLTATGDQTLPDAEQLNVNINTVKLVEILKGDNVYIQNSQGQWYVLSKSDFASAGANPFSGISFDQNTLLGAIAHIKLDDHGAENLNGQSLRHLTATLDKEAVKEILTQNPQLKSTFGQQDVDTLLNNTKKFVSTADVWIDEKQFYVHRTQLKLNLDANTSTVGNGAPSSVATALDTTVDLSNFNAPVTITPPTNATPTTNPAAIFGIGHP